MKERSGLSSRPQNTLETIRLKTNPLEKVGRNYIKKNLNGFVGTFRK